MQTDHRNYLNGPVLTNKNSDMNELARWRENLPADYRWIEAPEEWHSQEKDSKRV